jgi:DNA-directed RNA polymerase subunit RPC12/RpoP
MRCPVCESDNPRDATECIGCGKKLSGRPDAIGEGPRLEDLEQTLYTQGADAPAQFLPEMEQTRLVSKAIAVDAELIPGVERTQIEVDPGVASLWTSGIEVESGRETDDGVRTLAPQDEACPFCGAVAAGLLCDNCGRRKTLYLEPVEEGPSEDTVRCPACLSRVLAGPRCSDCGLPFPVTEI